jgi:phosphatidylserine/phosphatidylglycerophosphate/cardiolipin synthase-like enzyme
MRAMTSSGTPILSRFDAAIGDGIEATVRTKHRARLQRLGHGHIFDTSDSWWASGDPPPRPGCSLEVLIDGASAFPLIAEAIAGARESVHITGWHVAPNFELVRGREPTVLGEALAEAAERIDVRVLVWAGSPVPVFHPTRKEVLESIQMLTRRTKIRCEPDPREHPFHCHHEKTVIIDGTLAFVGGIDMTDMAGDRFDTPVHKARRRLGWHDVGTRLHGPVVADVAAHFDLRWKELTGDSAPEPAPPPATGEHTVQVVRTIAEGMYERVPHGEFRIFEAYTRALSQAQEFIYLENQFLWSPEIVDILADKLKSPPRDSFRLVIVLPSKANNGQDDTQGQLGVLQTADDGAGRLTAVTLRSRSGHRDDRLYVHAKVAIIDDHWLTIGSANLNAHSLFNDTEMNVVTDDRALAKDTRVRLWAEHLEMAPDAVAQREPTSIVDECWRPIAFEQLRRQKGGHPATHRLLALPGVSKRSRRLLGPLTGLVDDG